MAIIIGVWFFLLMVFIFVLVDMKNLVSWYDILVSGIISIGGGV